MTSKLMQLSRCRSCKENVEFVLKLIISNVQLCGAELKLGFSNLTLSLTLDGVVDRIDEIDEDEDIVRNLLFQATPENFNDKLHNSPIMLNLSRDKNDLGTIRISIADCFADAVMCDEFEGQRFESEYRFIKDKAITCGFDLSLQITRKPSDCQEFADYLKKRDRMKNKPKKDASFSDESNESFSALMCDNDLTTDNCPLDSDSDERMTSDSFRPSTSKSKSSYKSKCRSDIATSLDINDLNDVQKTFCNGCGGFSVSGVTCDNKDALSKAYGADSPPQACQSVQRLNTTKKCKIPVNRICSECFEDLTVVPHNAPCPKCDAYKRQLQRAVSFKSEKQQKNEQEKIQSCLRSIFEEILLGDKACVEKDMKRLKKNGRKMKIDEVCGEKKKKARNPRCDKIKKILNDASEGFKSRHPGIVRGHSTCMIEASLVPKNMGWLWNVQNPGIAKIRRGWQPGAVPKKVAKIMKYFLIEEQPPAEPCLSEICYENPGLHVQRSKGEYIIKMNPASGDGPVTFKIHKSDEAKKREEARKILKKRGIIKKCQCIKIEECQCINDCKKKDVTEALQNISTELSLKPKLKFNELNESSDSEMDFQYTPNIMAKSKFCKRPPICNVATQYEAQRIEEVIIEDKKMELKKLQQKLQQTMKGNSKATKSSLKGGKITVKNTAAKKEIEIKKDVKKNIESSGGKVISSSTLAPTAKTSCEQPQARKICNACTFNTCDVVDKNRFTTNYNPLYSQMPQSSTNYAANGNLNYPSDFHPSTCY